MRADEQPPFADFMGMKITHLSPERVSAEMKVTEQLSNRNGVLHGGAIMALADNLGGTATIANLPEGASTATIESKTNFFAGIAVGDIAHGNRKLKPRTVEGRRNRALANFVQGQCWGAEPGDAQSPGAGEHQVVTLARIGKHHYAVWILGGPRGGHARHYR